MQDEAVRSPGDAPLDSEAQARRAFLKKLAVAGATVPAVALLLNAQTARAQDGQAPGECTGGLCGNEYGGGTSTGTGVMGP